MTTIELQSAIIMNPLPFTIELFKGEEKQAELNYEAITARTLHFDRIAYDYFDEPILYRYPGNETVRVPAGSIVLFSLSDEPGKLNLWYKPMLSKLPVTISFLQEGSARHQQT
jgi:hypothetical protein